MAALTDSLAVERGARAVERDASRRQVTEARYVGAAALDSARATATSEVAAWIDVHALQDSVAFAGLAAEIASLEADTLAVHIELAATQSLLLTAREGWDTAELALTQSQIASDAWESTYRASQRSKWVERAGFVATVVCILKC